MRKKINDNGQEATLFDLPNGTNSTPLEGHQVAIIGRTAKLSNKELCDIFTNLGAKVTNVPSKNVSLLFLLGDLGSKNQELIDTLKFNGYDLNIFGEGDINAILDGNYEDYLILSQPIKNLILTPNHLSRLLTKLSWHASENIPISNPLYRHTLFFAPSIYHHVSPISQVMGNLGILLAGSEIDEETDIIVLPDESIESLSEGIRDENIKFIESSYNKSAQITFNFRFIRLSDIISYIEYRLSKIQDKYTESCFLKYKNTVCP